MRLRSRGNCARRRQLRHRAERRAERQVEMQSDRQVAALCAQGAAAVPANAADVTSTLVADSAARRGQLADGARNAFGHAHSRRRRG